MKLLIGLILLVGCAQSGNNAPKSVSTQIQNPTPGSDILVYSVKCSSGHFNGLSGGAWTYEINVYADGTKYIDCSVGNVKGHSFGPASKLSDRCVVYSEIKRYGQNVNFTFDYLENTGYGAFAYPGFENGQVERIDMADINPGPDYNHYGVGYCIQTPF